MTVTVITDSAAALPADVAEGFGVPVVPLWLHVGADSYRDGELALSDFLARLDEPCSTAAPSPGEFAKAIETAAENGPVVVLTVAATMSSTYASALLASRQTSADVTIVDTRSAAGAQGLVVVAAARAAAKGASVDEIVGVARLVSERVRLVATVPDVTRLARSGRLPAAAGRLGARIGAQPMFELRKGRVRPMRPAFSRAAALDRIAERCAGGRPGGRLHVAVLHALDPDAAAVLVERVTALEPATCVVGSFSPVMVAHTGGGLAGVAWRGASRRPPRCGRREGAGAPAVPNRGFTF